MKKLNFLFLFALLILVGCGHNVATNSRGIGVDLSWSGNSYIPNLRLGYWEATNATVRGNTSYTQNTTTGGTLLGSGGMSQTIQLRTGNQLNEGNLSKVLTSETASDEVKKEVVKATMTQKTPVPSPTSSKTVSAGAATGSNAPEADTVVTGTDKIVDKVAEVTKEAVPAVKEVANKTVETAGGAYTFTIKSVKSLVIFIVLLVILILIIGGYIYLKYFHKNKKKEDTEILAESINKTNNP